MDVDAAFLQLLAAPKMLQMLIRDLGVEARNFQRKLVKPADFW